MIRCWIWAGCWPPGASRTGPACSATLGGQDGLASTDDLLHRYARNTTRDLSQITWYAVLACFKLGIVIEGTLARACAGKADKGSATNCTPPRCSCSNGRWA